MWLLTAFGRARTALRSAEPASAAPADGGDGGERGSGGRRRRERFVSETLTSPLGVVKDVSAAGACITSIQKRDSSLVKGRIVPLQLDTPHGRLSFLARVAWVRRTRGGGYEAGFALLDVKPHVAVLLRQLGQFGFVPPPSDRPLDGAEAAPHVPLIPPELCRALEIAPDATDEEIFRAYRTVALTYHPDRNRSGNTARRFQEAAEAYRRLKTIRPGLRRRSSPQ
jgi:hypothetical protein